MRKFLICIMVLLPLITSCQSVRVEHKYIVPDIDFPNFPALDRTINADGSWTIPKEDIDALAEYYIKIQETEKNYNDIKRLLEKGEEQ